MAKKDRKEEYRALTRKTFEKDYGRSLSDDECEEIENNMKGFIKCLIEMDDNAKERKIIAGNVKCTKCDSDILSIKDFFNTSDNPICGDCLSKDIKENPQNYLLD